MSNANGERGGRGRGSGRGRGRGRSRGVAADALEDALQQVRVQRQATQRRVAALPAEVRRELVDRKRAAQLERMLLPDAPPRKRQTKKKSPERQPCVMAGLPGERCPADMAGPSTTSGRGLPHSVERYPADMAGPSTSSGQGLPHSVERYPADMAGPSTSSGQGLPHFVERYPADMAGPSTSTGQGLPHSVERYPADMAGPSTSTGQGLPHSVGRRSADLAGPSTSSDQGLPHSVDCVPNVVLEFIDEAVDDEIDIGAEITIPHSPAGKNISVPSIGAKDKDFETVVTNWLQFSDDDDDDNDLNDILNDDDACLLPITRGHAIEPADDTDLTESEAAVLRREDEINDRAIRHLVPDDCYTFDWTRDRQTFLGRREDFTMASGPTFDITDQTRPLDIFDKMFDADFIDLLCRETNRNAEQKIATMLEKEQLTPHSRFNKWTPTDRHEITTFLGILILQGLAPLPTERDYFSFNGFTTMPYFCRIMSYNRFILLKHFLHFTDSQTTQDKTRLNKIRPIVDYLNDKFSRLYMPGQEVVIDESLLKWHGRLSFAQKIASKAAQVGIKTYELCESSTGYLWKFFVYAGKQKTTDTQTDGQTNERPTDEEDEQNRNNDETDRPDRPTNATAIIVYDLIEPLLNRGHTLIMDNFYNSPLLLRSLKRQKTDCYGTLRLNREFVPDSVKTLTKTDLRKGEVVATYCADLSVLVWRDANVVSLISTYHNLEIGTQDKYNRVTYKPTIVLDYNKSMGGVDRKDQYLSAHPMERQRNKVWYKKLFRRLYNAALFNCFVIFRNGGSKMSHRQFRVVLAEEIMKRHRQLDLTTEPRLLTVRKSSGQKVTTRQPPRTKTQARPKLDHRHFPIKTGSRYTVCFLCPKKTRTSWKCEECNINLCIENCFAAYHT